MKVCIICQEEVSGKRAVKVKEDRVIRVIRKIKQTLNMATNNELYVSEECIPKHKERRRAFERSMLFFGILAAVIVILMLSSIFMSGKFDLGLIVSAFLIGGFILLFALIFKYTPAVDGDVATPIPGSSSPAEVKASEEKKVSTATRQKAKKAGKKGE